ncbi:MAG: CoA-binding protein [Deltaproteobacteria bacterium]|nr:MAG: CoA-binding protein [Deltaproteobacteria bacterium]
MPDASLTPFFAPTGVAVVGASARPESVGYALLRNLLFGGAGSNDRAAGFQGPVYAVNPKGGEILGHAVHASLATIDGPLDLVLIAVPGRFVPDLVDACADKGVRHVIVISAGFAEIGPEGKALQDAMLARAAARGVRLIGPNCLGIMRGVGGLNASFGAGAAPRGHIGLLSQSGALITGLVSYAERERFGLSTAVSLGAKADIDDEEIVDWLADDPETRVITLYAESFTRPRAVLEALKRASARKPVVAIKGGASDAGAKAASSHTGALTGSNAAYQAAFAQAGVLYAGDIGELMNWSRALSTQPPAPGSRLAIVTNAGGPGVLSADAASRHGLTLATLSDATLAALNEVLPSVWSHNNPVDVIGDATPERYRDALNILGRAPEVDGIVVIMTVQAMTAPLETARAIAEAHAEPSWEKPLLASFLGLVGTEVGTYLDERGVPEMNLPEEAISAMGALARRGAWLARPEPPVVPVPRHPAPDHERVRDCIARARAAGQTNLDLGLATALLGAAGLRYNRSETATDEDDAVRLAGDIGFPVVLKVISPDVLHKSDVGGVVLDVVDADGVRAACASIRERVGRGVPGARINGFTVEEQVKGTEIIVGVSRDPDFGPLLMVGMGGVFVEVYKDVSFGLVPLTRADAHRMIGEIRAQPLLDGARGRPVLDRGELVEVLMRISELVASFGDIAELDVNPLVLTQTGLVAIDARVILAADDAEGTR